jgi:hypothetical protein
MFGFMDDIIMALKEIRQKISTKGGEYFNQLNAYIFSGMTAAYS